MKLAYNLLFSLLLLLITGVSAHGAARQEFTKAIKREFDITANGTTSISNTYGKVDIKTWNRNQVKIDVTIVVNASSESAAQKVFDRIDISFSNTATSVKAVTTIAPRERSFWSWGGSDNSDFSINYDIYLPATNNLELQHKYGDAYVAAMTGKVTATLKYANLKLDGAGDASSLNLAYGNGTITKARGLYTDVSYAKIFITEAEDVEITSAYTQVNIDKAANIISTTKYDDYNVGTIRQLRNTGKYDNIDVESAESIEVSSKYTQVNARKVSRLVNLDLQYGGGDIGLSRSFQEANFSGNYADFKIAIESGAEYQLEASTSYAGITYPRDLNVTYELEKNSSHELKGYQGRQNAPATIKARLSYGGLKVREQ